MKISLTGASGFIGTKLLAKLAAQYGRESITVISSKEIEGFNCIGYKNNEIDAANGSITCDVAIHAGAYTPKSGAYANNITDCNSNVLFTESLLKRLDVDACRRIVNISTLDVYANSNNVKISETSSIDPVSLYGMSKLYCEKMIHGYAETNNAKSTTLRIGHVYGPGEEVYQKLLPIAISKILSDQPVELWGDGEDLRSFIHVDDVVDSIVAAIEKPVDADVINVVSGNTISIRQLVESLVGLSGKNVEIQTVPSNAPRRNLVFDNSLLRQTLLPEERNFDEQLREEFDYMAHLDEFHS